MELTIRHEGDVSIVEISGRILVGEGDQQMRDAIDGLVTEGRGRILLILEKVPYLDSMALGQLVTAQVRANKKGVALKLVGLNHVFRNLLAMMKLTEVFEIYERQEDAIASF
jgi:anti-sigma B factor antagonist